MSTPVGKQCQSQHRQAGTCSSDEIQLLGQLARSFFDREVGDSAGRGEPARITACSSAAPRTLKPQRISDVRTSICCHDVTLLSRRLSTASIPLVTSLRLPWAIGMLTCPAAHTNSSHPPLAHVPHLLFPPMFRHARQFYYWN